MMKFHTVDSDNWERKEYYQHYMDNVRCTYSLTTNIDITGLITAVRKQGKKIYPVQIYMISTMVNQYREFRMDMDPDGNPGYWEETYPAYTVFNKAKETFSGIWTPYNKRFDLFYESCLSDINNYSDATVFEPKGEGPPPNTFNISSLPWVSFTSLNLNVYNNGRHLPPIFTMGKFIEAEGKVMMPLSIHVHHAVCDGFHVGRFINSLQELAINYAGWLV